jgi:hypothetical protein
MGYRLPNGVVLERTQATNPSDMALLSHISKTLSPPERPGSPTGAIEEFLDNSCLDSIYFAAQECCPIDDSTNFDDWMACRALDPDRQLNNPDVLTQAQMLRAGDSKEFIRHQRDEIDALQGAKVFAYRRRSDLPEGASILNSIWSYRRKRRPDGTLLKYKTRICADGSMQQQGRDYNESYAPVVQWSSVRLCLVLAMMLNLPTEQIDFLQAFCNADIDTDVFIAIPQGWFYSAVTKRLEQHDDPRFRDTDHCMQLVKNLYGTKNAARNWYLHLKEILTSPHHGFRQSEIDPCVFIRDNCIILVYTDDCIILGQTDQTITDLRNTITDVDGLLHRSEGTLGDFLGVRMSVHTTAAGDRHLYMTQTGLIDTILTDVGLISSDTDPPRQKSPPSTKSVPAVATLRSDPDGPPYDASWSYRSIIGKLNFLAQNTRPDIAFAVHQCARFVSKPTKTHQDAVKHICRYLLGTRDKGIVLRPNNDHCVTAYVDADFAGLWHKDFAHTRECALSRTGFIICYANCPILWTSKLQTEVALSTCEAEYIALSTCARSLIPMRTLLTEISRFQPPAQHPTLTRVGTNDKPHMLCKQHRTKVFEDNAGALEIANQDSQYRPRTKHISIKWHRFRDHVRSGEMIVEKVDTTLQWADFLTKPLTREPFERLRSLVMGW